MCVSIRKYDGRAFLKNVYKTSIEAENMYNSDEAWEIDRKIDKTRGISTILASEIIKYFFEILLFKYIT